MEQEIETGPRLDLLHQVWEMLLGIHADPKASRAFDLNVYFGNRGLVRGVPIGPRELAERIAEAEPKDGWCGTVGCAMGFAKICVPGLRNTLPTRWSDCAVADAFGVDPGQVEYVFINSSYGGSEAVPTPLQVAKRVKDLINELAAAEA